MVHRNTPEINGMLHAVLPLVDVRPVALHPAVLAALQAQPAGPLPPMVFGHDAVLRLRDPPAQ